MALRFPIFIVERRMSVVRPSVGPKKLLLAIASVALMCGYGTGFAATPTGNANSLVTAPAGISYAALINKFTNHEWDNGSWRKSAGVSVQATAENLAAFRAGTLVSTVDGRLHTVTSVKTVGTSLSVFMQGAPLDGAVIGYPNRLRAVGSAPVDTGVMPVVTAALINKFTNHEWDNGSWRKTAGVSVQATAENLAAFRAGTLVRTADDRLHTVSSVKTVGANLSVFMQGAPLDGAVVGYPNRLRAVGSAAVEPPPADEKPGATPEVSPASPAALINKFTNHEWDNGSWRKSAGVSVQATAENLASFQVGASVVLADGQVRTITEVRKVGSNLTVLMDGPVLDGTLVGYPSRLSVLDPAAQQPALPEASRPPQEDARERISLVGVNLSGAGFGSSVLPGKHGTNYIYPAESYYQKYAGQGLNLVRLPFLWERIQPVLDSELNAAELARLVQSLDFAHKHGVKVILDLHNYYRYYGKLIGSPEVPIASFADVWRRIAQQVSEHPAVSGYGLMNEPYGTNGLWPEAALAASQAIRQIDAEHWIYVAGDRYSSAWHWPKYNARLVDDPWMRDPRNNLVYEAHMYLDRDTSGMYYDTTETFAPTLGIDRARPFVDWLKENGLRGYIGEFGVPAYAADAIDAMDNLLGYLRENCIPLTYWAAGPWWGDYVLALDVKSGEDRPQLPVLKKHAAAPSSCTSIGPLQ